MKKEWNTPQLLTYGPVEQITLVEKSSGKGDYYARTCLAPLASCFTCP